jgi:hypothetical protein
MPMAKTKRIKLEKIALVMVRKQCLVVAAAVAAVGEADAVNWKRLF